ncbi:MAG: 50S ribosomal protein L16 [Bacteroidota bacterium]
MLQPKRVKYRKCQKGKIGKIAQRGYTVSFGTFGIKVLEGGWLTARQIEAARVVINRTMKREGAMWIRIFPDKPITKKPAEVRMGKGKGAPEYWVAVVKPGKILFELEGVSEEVAKRAARLVRGKLPYKTKIVFREDYITA